MTSSQPESSFNASQSQSITKPFSFSIDEEALKRIGINATCFLYEEEKKTAFLEWWKKTDWYESNIIDGRPKVNIIWGSEKKATSWSYFHEGATVSAGEPMVICKICHTTMKHAANKNIGPSGMAAHLATKYCTKHGGGPTLRQLEYREAVSVILLTDY